MVFGSKLIFQYFLAFLVLESCELKSSYKVFPYNKLYFKLFYQPIQPFHLFYNFF